MFLEPHMRTVILTEAPGSCPFKWPTATVSNVKLSMHLSQRPRSACSVTRLDPTDGSASSLFDRLSYNAPEPS